jgi:hypothetical protein
MLPSRYFVFAVCVGLAALSILGLVQQGRG